MRMTDPTKWDDEWFLDLKPIEKLVWMYMCERCDIAGFYSIPKRKASFEIGVSVEEYLGAYEGLIRGYLGAKDNSIIWLRNFIKYQKNLPLNKWNNAHKSIIEKLKTNFDNFKQHDQYKSIPMEHLEVKSDRSSKIIVTNLGANKPLMRGTGTGKGKGKGKGNNKDKGLDKSTTSVILFEECWKLFGNYGTKSKALEYWNELNEDDHKNIKDRIPIYLNHLRVSGFSKKMFQGWINPKEKLFETTYENSTPNETDAPLYKNDYDPNNEMENAKPEDWGVSIDPSLQEELGGLFNDMQ